MTRGPITKAEETRDDSKAETGEAEEDVDVPIEDVARQDIGAHAAVAGHTLLTRDPQRYRSYFPKLRIVAP